MKRSYGAYSSVAIAVALALGGCSTWGQMDRSEKGTAVGATGGAIVGAAVGGPVGAAVGAGVGGYAGHYETQPGGLASNGAGTRYGRTGGTMHYGQNSETIRSVQQALNDQGYDAGAIDGQMGPSTQDALRRFQQAQNLPQTGQADARTLTALGISNQASNQTVNRSNSYTANRTPARAPNQSTPYHASNRYEAPSQRVMPSESRATGYSDDSDTVHSVQQALNDQGYNAGAVDGVMGPRTQRALRQFQQAQNLPRTGRPDERTLDALGVSNEASNQGSNPPNGASNPPSSPSNRASNQASNQPNASDESDQDLNQGSSRASNPANPSNPPSQASNQASNESMPPDESVPSDASNPPAASNPPRR